MTTATLATGNRTMMDMATGRPRRSLEELVDRLIETLFPAQTAPATETPSVAKSVHEARRCRQSGDVDGGLAILAGINTEKTENHEARWAYAEWTDLVRRRFGWSEVMVYSQGTARAAALVPTDDAGTLEVVAQSWGCAGGPARSSPGAACGGSGPWEGLAPDPGLVTLPG